MYFSMVFFLRFLLFMLFFAPGSPKAVSDQAKEFKPTPLRNENTPTDPPWMSRHGMLILSMFKRYSEINSGKKKEPKIS